MKSKLFVIRNARCEAMVKMVLNRVSILGFLILVGSFILAASFGSEALSAWLLGVIGAVLVLIGVMVEEDRKEKKALHNVEKENKG